MNSIHSSAQILSPWDIEPKNPLLYIANLEKDLLASARNQNLTRMGSANIHRNPKIPAPSNKLSKRTVKKLSFAIQTNQGNQLEENTLRTSSSRFRYLQTSVDKVNSRENEANLLIKPSKPTGILSPRENVHKKVPTKMKYQKLITMIRKVKDYSPKQNKSSTTNYSQIQHLISSLQTTSSANRADLGSKNSRKPDLQIQEEIISHPRHRILTDSDKKIQKNPFSERLGHYFERAAIGRPYSSALSVFQSTSTFNSPMTSPQNFANRGKPTEHLVTRQTPPSDYDIEFLNRSHPNDEERIGKLSSNRIKHSEATSYQPFRAEASKSFRLSSAGSCVDNGEKKSKMKHSQGIQTDESIYKRSFISYNEQNQTNTHRPIGNYQNLKFTLKPNDYGIVKPNFEGGHRPSTSIQGVTSSQRTLRNMQGLTNGILLGSARPRSNLYIDNNLKLVIPTEKRRVGEKSDAFGQEEQNTAQDLKINSLSFGFNTKRIKRISSQGSFTKYPKNYKDALELYKDDEKEGTEFYSLSARYI